MTLNKISKSFFINLDRRTDRLDHIYKHVPFYTERFAAVDANTLELNDEIKALFPQTYHLLSKAEIACALSHYKLWKQLAADKDSKSYLILEDDVVFEEGFVEQWNNQFSKVFPHDFMLVYVGGCQPWNKSHYNEVLDPFNQHFNNIKKNDFFTKGDHYWHMNASSYIVSRRAATLLCQYVDQLGFDAAWDVFIINFFNNNKIFTCPHLVYHLNPLMARQIHEENENIEADKNSDIRFNKDRFDKKGKTKEKESKKIKVIWQVDPNNNNETYESDWLRELLSDIDYEEVVDCNYSVLQDDAIIIYTDIWHHTKNDTRQEILYNYLDKASKHKNVSIIHLGDEYTQARTDHYKNFKLAIRTTYNHSVRDVKNLIQIPLGYKQGFHD